LLEVQVKFYNVKDFCDELKDDEFAFIAISFYISSFFRRKRLNTRRFTSQKLQIKCEIAID
jgi:hypothetical protein